MNTSACIFAVLTVLTLTPVLGVPSFTLLFSRYTTPKIVQRTHNFRQTNRILSYAWAVIFAISAVIALFPATTLWQYLLPLCFMAVSGSIATIWGIRQIPQYLKETYQPASCEELFQLQPYGLNRRYAKKLNREAVVQFALSGDENINGFLTIKKDRCTYQTGIAENYTTKISCDSKLWLDISNGVIDPVKASIEGEITTEGDATILLHLRPLFSTGWKTTAPYTSSISKELYKEYKHLKPVEIKKVVIFYSGMRKKGMSKTLFMAEHLASGIEDAGGSVEIVHLREKKINPCLGCYSCWTKTPGKCVYKDDMDELLEKYLQADLAVYASPLYIFSVNGVMKTFLDRIIPILKPYMETAHDGHTMHPDRYADITPTHTLVVSSAGFPDIKNNFEGLRTLFKQWTGHSQKGTLRGELLLPAAELIARPEFADRKQRVAELCFEIGRQLVHNGCPDVELMRAISDTGLSHEQFKSMANIFWENLDGKKSYMATIDKL